VIPLLAAILGALIGVIATELARKRRDQAAAEARLRAAARMVSAEMGMAALALESAKTGGVWHLASLPTAGWQEHGADLAAALSEEQFYVVGEVATKVGAIRALTEISQTTPEIVASQMRGVVNPDMPFDDVIGECRKAQEVLRRFAYPDDWRLHPGNA